MKIMKAMKVLCYNLKTTKFYINEHYKLNKDFKFFYDCVNLVYSNF